MKLVYAKNAKWVLSGPQLQKFAQLNIGGFIMKKTKVTVLRQGLPRLFILRHRPVCVSSLVLPLRRHIRNLRVRA